MVDLKRLTFWQRLIAGPHALQQAEILLLAREAAAARAAEARALDNQATGSGLANAPAAVPPAELPGNTTLDRLDALLVRLETRQREGRLKL